MPSVCCARPPRLGRSASLPSEGASRGLIRSLTLSLLAVVLVVNGSPRGLALSSGAAAAELGGTGLAWGLVLSADKTTSLAEPELSRYSRLLGVRPRLYLCNGWYRAVAAYRSEREAIAALQKVLRSGPKRSPYIVSIPAWCPSKKLISSG